MTSNSRNERIRQLIKEKGIFWTISYIIEYTIRNRFLDNLSKKKLTEGKELIDLPSHSVEANKKLWNDYYDWSNSGEEWTQEVKKYKGIDPKKWKDELVKNMMQKYLTKDSTILEIGPGGGRWTSILKEISNNLILADISPKCLDICKERFADSEHIKYNLIENDLSFIEDSSIDYIWSYDVFVHINPSIIKKYVEEFQRILKPNGIAIIHHSGKYADYNNPKEGWRAFFGKDEFLKLINDNSLKMSEQNIDLSHLPGDVISVFTK